MILGDVAVGRKRIQYVVPIGTAIELWHDDPNINDRYASTAVSTKEEVTFTQKDLISDPSGRNALINHNYPGSYVFNVSKNKWVNDGMSVWAIRIPNEGIEMKFEDI